MVIQVKVRVEVIAMSDYSDFRVTFMSSYIYPQGAPSGVTRQSDLGGDPVPSAVFFSSIFYIFYSIFLIFLYILLYFSIYSIVLG